jgi:putative tryptophan/tyrosine transport system substrate-binding protein
MRRRQFILLCCAAAITKPRAACAQKPDRVRRIGVLMPFGAGDAEGLRRARAFSQGLHDLGWVDGQNVRFEYRWPDGEIEQIQSLAKELVGSRPDVLVAAGRTQAAALQQATRSTPIVFLMHDDPVSQGIVESLARPGGNVALGFM